MSSLLFQTPGLCFEDTFNEKVFISHTILKPYTEMSITLNVSISSRIVENGTAALQVIITCSISITCVTGFVLTREVTHGV